MNAIHVRLYSMETRATTAIVLKTTRLYVSKKRCVSQLLLRTRPRIFETVDSDCICCAERKLIKNLKHQCSKKGYRIHKFSSWVKRKYGAIVIYRKTSYGDGISLPCVLCRKVIEKYDIKWMAHDGNGWVHSEKTDVLPKSKPTSKQCRTLRFGLND